MTDYVQLVGCDVPGAAGSCCYFSEQRRILFNVPEGTQRFCGDARIRIARIDTFLFTRIEASTVMGLPGFLFTVNDTGVAAASFGGPIAGLGPFLTAVREAFFRYRTFDFRMLDFSADAPLLFEARLTEATRVVAVATGPATVSYAIIVAPTRAFQPGRAKELGVRPGPKYAALKRGESVQSDTDPAVTVTPEQVMGAERGGRATVTLIFDADDVAAGSAAVARALAAVGPSDVRRVVHLARNHGGAAAEAAVASALGAGIHHVWATEPRRAGFSAFPTAQVHRHHLRHLEPACFAAPPPSPADAPGSGPVVWPYSLRYRCAGDQAAPQPVRPGEEPLWYPTEATAMRMLSDEFLREAGLASGAAATGAAEPPALDDAIAFLGTGSAVPSKYRNVSGAVLCDGGRAVVLDFGEGSLGQLHQLLGGSDAALDDVVARCALVFISHTHADHNLGLFSLLERRWALARRCAAPLQPLLVVAPADFVAFVRTACEALSLGGALACAEAEVRFDTFSAPVADDTSAGASDSSGEGLPHFRALCATLGWTGDVFPVDHPAHAHALVVRSPRRAWLYSGDTRPSELLVARAVAFGPLDVLVHEATFDDALQHEAVAKRHSTLGESLRVAAQAGARHVLLTHFSQRYPKMPALAAEGEPQRPFSFSFDLMVVPFARLAALPHRTPLFQRLLEEYDRWGVGTSKRLRDDVSAEPVGEEAA